MLKGDEIKKLFYDCFSISFDPFTIENQNLWDETLRKCAYTPVEYTLASLRYQFEYMKCFTSNMINLSVLLRSSQGEYIGIWALTLKQNEGIYTFTTNESGVLPPLLIENIAEKQRKKIYSVCYTAIQALYQELKRRGESVSPEWESRYRLDCGEWKYQTEWYQICMEHGATLQTYTDLFANLSMSIDEIYKKIRKSYHALLHKGEKMWKISVMDTVSESQYEAFHQKHIEVAGRVTRSSESWDRQRESINHGSAFLILLHDPENQNLIGGGLFSISADEGRYDVGVYDRSLFQFPVGHAVQWKAIEHMKQMGIKRYYIGQRFYPSDVPSPTEKELSISYYKQGFATEIAFRFMIKNHLEDITI